MIQWFKDLWHALWYDDDKFFTPAGEFFTCHKVGTKETYVEVSVYKFDETFYLLGVTKRELAELRAFTDPDKLHDHASLLEATYDAASMTDD